MRLERLVGAHAVARAAAASTALPAGFLAAGGTEALVSVTRLGEELSLVAPEALIDTFAGLERIERGWTAFRVEGPLDFALTGVLADLSGALAAAGISLFAISTHDTDCILVRERDAEAAAAAWRAAGHEVVPA